MTTEAGLTKRRTAPASAGITAACSRQVTWASTSQWAGQPAQSSAQ